MNMRLHLCSFAAIAVALSSQPVMAQTFEVVAQFPQNMIRPSGGLIAGPNLENPTQLRLYGLSEHGGTGGAGVLFSYEPATGVFVIEADFGTNFFTTASPTLQSARVGQGEHRIVSIGGSIYGVTAEGGPLGYGIVWRWTPTPIVNPPATPGPELFKLAEFDRTNYGAHPRYGVVTDGANLYGTCSEGGGNSQGTLWRVPIGGGTPVTLYDFTIPTAITGIGASTGGVTYSDGRLYGLAQKTDIGTSVTTDLLWSYLNPTTGSPASNLMNQEYAFNPTTDFHPRGILVSNTSGGVVGVTYESATGSAGPARLFYYDFDNSPPLLRVSGSVGALASPGRVSLSNFQGNAVYGVTETGSAVGDVNGRLFSWGRVHNAAITTRKTFSTGGSKKPVGQAYVDTLGDSITGNDIVYGTSVAGGTAGEGSLWKFDAVTDAITTPFECTSSSLGGHPDGVVSDPNGNIFGTERIGDSIWRWNPATGLERVSRFENLAQGVAPFGQLALKPDGSVFGVTSNGGTSGDGTFWQWNQHGGILARSSLGAATAPGIASGGVVMDSAGNIYGISNNLSSASPVTSLWRMSAGGTFSKLVTFNATAHGTFSIGSLAVDGSGAVYGVCVLGGEHDAGSLWKWASGSLTRLASFHPSNHPQRPRGGIAVAADGSAVYGTSRSGNVSEGGRLWSWTQSTGNLAAIATLTKATHGELIELDSGVDINGAPLLLATAPIVLSSAGTLYGATDRNGTGGLGCGVLWNYSTGLGGAINVVKAFHRSQNDGARGVSSLAFGSDGRLYGATDNALWRYGPTPSSQPPSVVTRDVSSASATKLTLTGVVHPHGLSTTVTFEFGTSPTNLTQTINATPGNANGSAPVNVSATITFLNPDTTYYYRVAGASTGGISKGGTAKAKTAAQSAPPLVTTKPATAIDHAMATLNGSVNPQGSLSPVDIVIQWGMSATTLTNTAVPMPATATGTTVTDFSFNLTSLSPHTKYYYRAAAANDQGLGTGAVLNFTTLNRPPSGMGDSYFALPGAPVAMNVLFNDSDPDLDALSIKSFTQPPAAAGKVTKSGNSLIFTPSAGFGAFVGPATFEYTPQDSLGLAAAAAVTVTINRDTVSLNPTDNLGLQAASTTYPILIDAGNAGTPWKAVETSPFVTLSATGGNGDATINVTVAHNTTKNPRSATIVIGGATHTLTQAGVVSPTLSTPGMVPPAIVSGTFSLPIHTYLPAPVYTVSKAPPGLKLVVNPTTGQAVLQGKPDKHGLFDVTIKAVNAATTAAATINFQINVRALPDHMIGDHVSLLENDADFNNDIGGTIAFKTQSTGSFSGSVRLGTAKTAPETLPFSGRLDAVATTMPTAVPPATATVSIQRKAPLPPLVLTLHLDNADGAGENIVTGSLQVQGNSATQANHNGWRNKWSSVLPATTLVGPAPANKPLKEYYTVGLTSPGGSGIPEGTGYTTFTLQPTGSVTWSTTLADGVTVTGTTFLSPTNNRFILWAALYKKATLEYLGMVRGLPQITRPANTVAGSLQWKKTMQASPPGVAPTYSYLGGFDITLAASGALYTPPTGIILGLSPTFPNPNAHLDFQLGGLADSSQHTAGNLDQTFVITTANTATFTKANNPCGVTMTINKTLGLFNGFFTLSDTKPAGTIKRPNIAYKGVLLPDNAMPVNGRGKGFCNISQLPISGTSTTTTDRLSWPVELRPYP